jgi:glycosyltransferase involved in cell wall biosynthesis
MKITNTSVYGIANWLAAEHRLHRTMVALHRAVSACIVTSTAAADEARMFGIPEARIQLLPNGIDVDVYKPASENQKMNLRKRLGITNTLVVLYSGRLETWKNPRGLVESWSAIHRDVDAVLVMIGGGSLRAALQERCNSLGVASSVLFAGPQSDVLPWYHIADVFVLPSLYEGLSNSLLEAMSCGLPVVSTRVSGSSDIFAEADIGELVEPGDATGMARSLGRLLSDPGRRAACGARAREYANSKFAINGVARETSALYERLIARRAELAG